jgi:hypothetical protein
MARNRAVPTLAVTPDPRHRAAAQLRFAADENLASLGFRS